MPRDLGPADVDAEAAGNGEPPDTPSPSGVQGVQQAGQVGAEEVDRVLTGDGAGQMDDVGDRRTACPGQGRRPGR